VQGADLHNLDSNKGHIFHSGVREKGLFHRPLKKFRGFVALPVFSHFLTVQGKDIV